MSDFDELHNKLKSVAETVNAFKSEAVQLRIVEALLTQIGVAEHARGEDRRARKRQKNPTKGADAPVQAESPRKRTSKKSRGAGSPGAFATISDLLASGFFATPKTIGAIVQHAGQSRGHHYKANECSPALLRLLRDGKLQRAKNNDGQYEYTEG